MDNTRVFRMTFASVYPHYVAKAEKKGRTKEELHAIIRWLTGYDQQTLQEQIDKKVDFVALESALMEEGIQKFVAPQQALLKLIAQKREIACLS